MSATQPITEYLERERFPRTPRNVRSFERGWCAAAMAGVSLYPGTDLARVRLALELEHRGWPTSPVVNRAFGRGVRAKLAHLRAMGVIQ